MLRKALLQIGFPKKRYHDYNAAYCSWHEEESITLLSNFSQPGQRFLCRMPTAVEEFIRCRHYMREALQTGSAAKILLLTFEALVYYIALLTAESKVSTHEEAIPKQIQALEILVLARHPPWVFASLQGARRALAGGTVYRVAT